ncbi:MAG: type III-B CRISPR-associated protein Cas10/Cmr2 [Acidobacteriota bacterium]
MSSPGRLYFSIGPVQGFVSQSRRTRDLWASSFLLSFLAKAAMDAVVTSRGKIVLPAELSSNGSQAGPPHGNVPNRFVAEVSDPVGVVTSVTQAFHDAWQRIVQAVWDRFVEPVFNLGNGTRTIWNRQANNFWELSWGVGSSDEDPLPRRKNWRTSPVTVEPGDHCSMMGQWQELSGFIRSQQRVQQDRFWEAIRGKAGQLDLDPDERLCAVALVKRLVPRVAAQAFGRELDAENWPSTPYIAAIPWLRGIGESRPGVLQGARTYAAKVRRVAEQALGERHTRIKSLSALNQSKDLGDFYRLDGNFFHERALKNERFVPLPAGVLREELLQQLKVIGDKAKASLRSFYAILLMDGDSMGELLGEARIRGKEAEATRALGHFAGSVPSVVEDHDGIVVYAGGDDVLALLPHDRALACAERLCDQYRKPFEPCGSDLAARASLSGALLYCDYQLPLRSVLQSAHQLLDHVAKDATGRDSLVLAVWKGSGLVAQWAAPWPHLRRQGGNLLEELAAKLRPQERLDVKASPAQFSSSFLYRLRQLFASLTDSPLEEPGSFGTVVEGVEAQNLFALLLAEYLRGLAHRSRREEDDAQQRAAAEQNIKLLLEVCFRVTRDSEGHIVRHDGRGGTSCRVGIDGVRLIHFLAMIGREDES